jgi:low affinity Fe/Cu permease
MKKLYHRVEEYFEKFSQAALSILGSSISFILACCLVIYWLTDSIFIKQNMHEIIKDLFLAITFLSFFIIQKSVNKFSKALHIKLNELVVSHESASNELVNIEKKTEKELNEMTEKYSDVPENISSDKQPQGGK